MPSKVILNGGFMLSKRVMFAWFFRLPLLVRVPLLSAVMIFVIAMLIMQIAVLSLTTQYESQTQRVGQVYLDGLSAAVTQAYQDRDVPAIQRALEHSLRFYYGVVDRQLAILDRQEGMLAHVAGANLTAVTNPPKEVMTQPTGYQYDPGSRSLWVWRGLAEQGIVAANLDVSAFARERSLLQMRLTGIGLLLSALFAWCSYLVLRRTQQPLSVLSEHLRQAVSFGPRKIQDHEISGQDYDFQTLARGYNQMVVSVQERERMIDHLALQDRQAMLGRIAATLAHEIRNPLTGIMTALQTVRMYGDDPVNRNEALDFVDRGIQSLQGVAQATLNMYRPDSGAAGLKPKDLEDVARLVAPQAKQKQVSVETDLTYFQTLDLDAFKVRQIVLNLLLNAIQTSPLGGVVCYRVTHAEQSLMISVSDQGPGLPQQARDFLQSEQACSVDTWLGLATIRRLSDELGGQISLESEPGKGSLISLHFSLSAMVSTI